MSAPNVAVIVWVAVTLENVYPLVIAVANVGVVPLERAVPSTVIEETT